MITMTPAAAAPDAESIRAELRADALPDDEFAVAAVRWLIAHDEQQQTPGNRMNKGELAGHCGREFIIRCSKAQLNPLEESVTAYAGYDKRGINQKGLVFVVEVQTLIDRAHDTGLVTNIEIGTRMRDERDGRSSRIAFARVTRWVEPSEAMQARHVARVASAMKALQATGGLVDAGELVRHCAMPPVERTFLAEACVEEWSQKEGQRRSPSPFWVNAPEHQTMLVALRRALRNSGLTTDVTAEDPGISGLVDAISTDGDPGDGPGDGPRGGQRPVQNPQPSSNVPTSQVDRARAALSGATSQPSPQSSASQRPVQSSPSPSASQRPVQSSPSPQPTQPQPPAETDEVAAAAKRHQLSREDVESFCQRWKGCSLDELSEQDRRTLVRGPLGRGGQRIASKAQFEAVERLKARSPVEFDRLFAEASSGDAYYSPAHLFADTAQRLLQAARSAGLMAGGGSNGGSNGAATQRASHEQLGDVDDLATAYREAGMVQRWQRICADVVGGVAQLPRLTAAQADRLLQAANDDWNKALNSSQGA